MPVELWPVMQHRMESLPRRARQVGLVADNDPSSRPTCSPRCATAAPSTARDLDDGLPRAKDNWGWNWSETRKVLDYLFTSGELAIAGRNSQFEIRYDLPERVLPRAVLAQPTPSRAEAQPRAGPPRGPVARRRHRPGPARLLPDAGRRADRARGRRRWSRRASCSRCTVEGWKRPAYLHRDARLPRRVGARALLSPFDPVVWERARTEALFDFHYRIEIYVPGRQAGARLLRAAVPARRPDRRPGRPQGRPARPGGCWSRRRTPSRARPPRPPRSSSAELPTLAELARPRRRSRSSRGATWRRRCAADAGCPALGRVAPLIHCLKEWTPCLPSRQDPPHRRGQDPAPARGCRHRPSTPSRTTSSR